MNTEPERRPLMSELNALEASSLAARREKAADALVAEFVRDVHDRFDYMSGLNAAARETFRKDPALKENFLRDIERTPDFLSDVLVKLHRGDAAKTEELQECMRARDEKKLRRMYEEARTEKPKEFNAVREEKGAWRYVGPHGDAKLFNEKMAVLKAQTNRYAAFDGRVDAPEGKTDLNGYCAQGILLSLYKMKARYGSKAFDFLPETSKALRPANLVDHLKESPHLYRTADAGSFGKLAADRGLQPGALVIALTKAGRPHHMMMMESAEFLMGFNDDKKGTPADKFNSIVIDVPAMIRERVAQMSAHELDALERKRAVPAAERDWSDTLAEGKKAGPQEQWSSYYKRSDVRYETAKRVSASKQNLAAKHSAFSAVRSGQER